MKLTLKGLIPLIIFALLGMVLAIGLTKDPRKLPSAMIDRPFPAFSLPDLMDMETNIDQTYFHNQVTLVNVFGSWCVACDQEHPTLMRMAQENVLPILGVDWRDSVDQGRRWLERRGNPYRDIVFDADSLLAIDLGVTGAPESFLVDKKGQIRYKYVGPITPKLWKAELKPLVLSLQAESMQTNAEGG